MTRVDDGNDQLSVDGEKSLPSRGRTSLQSELNLKCVILF